LKEHATEFSMSAENLCLPYFKPLEGSAAISFTLPKHKISFVLGANGSGKSTLLKTLLGFLHPQSGRCSAQGLSMQQRAAQIAWVDQSVATDIAYSVIEHKPCTTWGSLTMRKDNSAHFRVANNVE
jgi:ABC-type Mn2+/Zn2+ transport system ATPase subunit